jgi:hypothetical protein
MSEGYVNISWLTLISCLFFVSEEKFDFLQFVTCKAMQRVMYSNLRSSLMLCRRKPKNARTKRLLEKRSPKQVENPKQAVFVRASTASAQTQSILADLVPPHD